MAAMVGYFVGVFFAVAGCGYIFIALLWALQVRKRWPRATLWSAIGLAALLGAITASAGNEPVLTGAATLAAVAFMAWRGRIKPTSSTGPSPA